MLVISQINSIKSFLPHIKTKEHQQSKRSEELNSRLAIAIYQIQNNSKNMTSLLFFARYDRYLYRMTQFSRQNQYLINTGSL